MSIHMSGAETEGMSGTAYASVCTSSGLQWQRWKSSDMSHVLSSTGASPGSISRIFCRRRGRHDLNYITFDFVEETVEVLTEGVTSSGSLDELQISWGFLFGWSMHTRREMRICLPKKWRISSSVRIKLTPALNVPRAPCNRIN